MKRLFVLLSAIASISSVYADRSISLVVQPANAANIPEWNNFSDSGNLVSKNISVNSVFSAFSDIILSEIHQKDGYTAFLHTCVFTKAGETAGHKTFLVLSPTIYEEWDNMVYPLNDVPDACEWTLNFSDIPWKIKRIELDAVNYGMINPHDNGKYSSGIIVLNGKEQVLDKNSDLTILGFDFAEGEREMSKIVLTAPKSASVGISTIRIFPDVENKFIATPGFAGKLEYSAEGVYSLPLPEEGTFHRPELLKTAIFDNTGSIVSCTCRYSDNNQFTLSAGEDFAPIQEGLYGICYYYDDGDYKPVAEDGLRFSITPSIAGLSLNLIKIDSENSFVEIPYNKEMPGMTYSATKAVISGEKDGTIIYWKVDRQGSKFYVEDDGAINISESEQESALPEGYSVYDDRGINLTQGNRLSLILERNGARSNPYEISYFITDVPTGVNLAEDESSVETFQFFTIAGTILDADKLDNFQGIYLEKITSANGEIKVIKHIK